MLNLKKWMMKVTDMLSQHNKNYTGTLTIKSGVNATVHSSTRIIRNGNIVSCYIRLQPITIPTGTTVIGTINNDDAEHSVRPSLVTYAMGVGSGGVAINANINAIGELSVAPVSAISNGFICLDMVWAKEPVSA